MEGKHGGKTCNLFMHSRSISLVTWSLAGFLSAHDELDDDDTLAEFVSVNWPAAGDCIIGGFGSKTGTLSDFTEKEREQEITTDDPFYFFLLA